MCGITGIAPADPAQAPDPAMLRRMADTLRHRGPDGEGFHVAPGIGLGFRRLAIIDLATGDQPIASEDGDVVAVCNGEIYNHAALRADLTARGHRFRTRSDAEVIVHLYEERGDGFVHALRGMFAIALWDARAHKLLLVRDRIGIKPMHYAVTGGALVFGSEPKAILASGLVARVPDVHALRQVFSYGSVITPRTLVEGVRRLPPGQRLVWSGGRARVETWWDLDFPDAGDYDRRTSADEWAEGLRAKLDETVRMHLVSDVPLAAWLSGGVDSSSVAALMSGMVDPPLRTYTLAFEDPAFDETRAGPLLDAYPGFRLDARRALCTRADLDRFPDVVWHNEDIVNGVVSIAIQIIAEATATERKVALAGEGADEVFGGYRWYGHLKLLAPVFALPLPLRRMIAAFPGIRRRWPGGAGVIVGPREIGFERYVRSIGRVGNESRAREVLSADILDRIDRDGPIDDAQPVPERFSRWHPFAGLQYLDLRNRMANSIVQGLDRMSMSRSIEARVPFLDHELVEFAARIPPWVKMRGLTEKHVLRRAMADTLPAPIAWRRKRGLQVPMVSWMRGELPGFANDLLAPRAIRDAGIFRPEAFERLLARHRSAVDDHGYLIASILGVQLWHAQFVAGRDDLHGPAARPPLRVSAVPG